MGKKRLCVAIPASVVSDVPHLREKTSKIGLVGRAAAIFRVDEIIVYPDNPRTIQKADIRLIAALLNYMETPQYLRKRLFRLEPELQYAGILPPLRTAHHPLNHRMKDLRIGEYREGVALSRTSEGALIDIGVEQPALAKNVQLATGKRVTVKIVKINNVVEVASASREEISGYWGFTVTVEKDTFGRFVKRRGFDLTIATSKYGSLFIDVMETIHGKWRKADTVLMAFGAPTHGLNEIAELEGLRLDDIFDFVVNTIPMQGTETVRTEEALIASLAILNVTEKTKA